MFNSKRPSTEVARLLRSGALTLVLMLVATLAFSVSVTRNEAQAAPLTGSAWCQNHDSIALLGASSGTGVQTSGYTRTDGLYQSTTYGWWARTTRLLDAQFPGLVAENFSKSGASVPNFMPGSTTVRNKDALPWIEANKPDAVMVWLGTNEYLGKVPSATYKTNLGNLVTEIRNRSANSAIILVTAWEVQWPDAIEPWSNYARAIYDTAVERQTVMIDVRQSLPYRASASSDPLDFFAPDGIHANDRGQMSLTSGMYGWLGPNSC